MVYQPFDTIRDSMLDCLTTSDAVLDSATLILPETETALLSAVDARTDTLTAFESAVLVSPDHAVLALTAFESAVEIGPEFDTAFESATEIVADNDVALESATDACVPAESARLSDSEMRATTPWAVDSAILTLTESCTALESAVLIG